MSSYSRSVLLKTDLQVSFCMSIHSGPIARIMMSLPCKLLSVSDVQACSKTQFSMSAKENNLSKAVTDQSIEKRCETLKFVPKRYC